MQKKGIVGRGILIDYHTYRGTHPSPSTLAPYDPFSRTPISLAELQACLAAQGTEIRFGDILFTRTGFTAAHATLSDSRLAALQQQNPHTFGGLEQSDAALRWIWDNFAAVAGDQPSFECWPSQWVRDTSSGAPFAMHEALLAGWGCPIGELFDLEALAEQCKAEGRWSFFVASEPCNVPGGVARYVETQPSTIVGD